jgi:exosortase D (VPLPA-CTERM-specific)
MNSFRIGVVGFLVNRWGIETAEGFLHDFEGWVVFMASLALLMLEMLLLAKLGNDSRSLTEMFGLVDDNTPVVRVGAENEVDDQQIPFYASWAILILVSGLLFTIGKREEIIPERLSFVDFPMQINSWQGRRLGIDNPTMALLQFTDYILSDYQKNFGEVVNFYVAYYESQRRSVVPHSPRVCIPGGGWEIAGISRETVEGLPVNRMVIKKGEDKSLVYYWYQQRGQVLANEYLMKWSLFKDALLLNRTDGALVRLNTRVYPGENLDEAEQRLHKFLVEIKPLLGDYIPE